MTQTDLDLTQRQALRQGATWSLVMGLLLIGLGLFAILSPFSVALSASVLFGWLLILAGAAQVVHAVQSRQAGYFVWKLIVGLFYIATGFFIFSTPILTAFSLTLVLAVGIALAGLAQLAAAVQMRGSQGWIWLLLDGLAGFALALLILQGWPSNAVRFLGLWVGLKLVFDGIGMATIASALRSALKEPVSVA